MGSSGGPVKAGLAALAVTLYPDALVCYGLPTRYPFGAIASIGNQETTVDYGPMSTMRRIEEVIETTVDLSYTVSTTATAQSEATDAAFAMLDQLIEHFQTAPNETLSGACREARVVGWSLVEDTDEGRIETGRNSTITVTIESKARI